ncbi:bifunctional metallophosphatase/5'-nucleotidase [Roseinatronobacter bogoriensis]|uniref:Multifunctional 2',3'-cyclic-nucleotide 2'-phosphodiesterase/5'-nucleotidase/3'-nucleotidase n=1 Tax=Roseinatronobacter bogoriensis subsp. barguzinensis TaxID=441209 RepID=A0A2K8KEZ6_9RHOB|nr:MULTISPECIES: 5'-nucleotidase C-terminal domain-containing protein [Rhodobaca]ATX67566.1 multifunctional 2',3'-cyclic-nucleotide 2'-phosphodiesterase/5'-nucleotidase/3'-nucleotidase [Rhodobaca barguzinensis]MBB4209093.1 5'-nucleotidase [Rhodobaca bogoriensis DSM 18756]TDW36379.1 5'-nucleotidase [Rhodobaca barguzinensis]TDY67493.1 5'-nucleotidase [Rhodobaca bogoriensis DSM 18756]
MAYHKDNSALSRRGFLSVAGASLALAGAGQFTLRTAQAGTGFSLAVLHINDMHSRVDEISRFNSNCSPSDAEDSNCFGGAARLATAIRQYRATHDEQGRPVLTLDAGDQSQGTLYYTTYGGRAEVQMMNAIGFDAMGIGNHEFNRGPENLARMIEEADFPVVSGNIKVAEGSVLADKIAPHVVVERNGEQIGILGITTPDTVFLSSPGEDVTFQDEIEHLREGVAELQGQGITKILVLSHVGFGRDQQIAAEVDGISAIIGGHSHTLMSNTEEGAVEYATLVESPSGRAVPIVQAFAFSRYLGNLTLEFAEDGAVVSATGDTVLLDASFAPAEDIEALIAPLRAPIEEMTRRPVAELAADIDGSRETCRAGECEMGNTVTDAMLSEVAHQGIQIALTNGGGLRASMGAGTATLGDVLTVLPFQNTLYTLEVSGETLLAALEHGVNDVEDGAGRFPQVAGIRFKLDLSVAPNSGRVSDVEVMSAEGWTALQPAEIYGLVTNNFMAGGGDGYAMLRDGGMNGYDTAIDLAEILARYLSENEPFAPVLDGRIVQ